MNSPLPPPPPKAGVGNYDHPWQIQGGVNAPIWDFEANKKNLSIVSLYVPLFLNSPPPLNSSGVVVVTHPRPCDRLGGG